MKTRIKWDDVVAARAAAEGGRDGTTMAAGAILDAANQIVPFETGELAGSGAVDIDPDALTAHVFYDTVYAARLHQNPKFHFQNGRRGKYLQTAVTQGKKVVMEHWAKGLTMRFRRR